MKRSKLASILSAAVAVPLILSSFAGAAQVNLVPNGDFSQGMTGWDDWFPSLSNIYVTSDEHLFIQGKTAKAEWHFHSVSRCIQGVPPADEYTMSADVLFPPGQGRNGRGMVRVQSYVTANCGTAAVQDEPPVLPKSGWQNVTYKISAPAGTQAFRITLAVETWEAQPGQDPNITLWAEFDNVSITAEVNDDPPADDPQDPPADDPTPPADDPTPPADDPTPPADDPTPPADDPTPPADDPTPPADDPTPPADDPTPPADDPTPPADDPTPPADDPQNAPADDPTPPADDPTPPADDPAPPADDPAPPADDPQGAPVDDPQEPLASKPEAPKPAATEPPIEPTAAFEPEEPVAAEAPTEPSATPLPPTAGTGVSTGTGGNLPLAAGLALTLLSATTAALTAAGARMKRR